MDYGAGLCYTNHHESYESYTETLKDLGIMRLSGRRNIICLKFAKNSMKLNNFMQLFPKHSNMHEMETRQHQKYHVVKSNSKRHSMSAIPSMQRLLNREFVEQKKLQRKLKNSMMSPTNFASSQDLLLR